MAATNVIIDTYAAMAIVDHCKRVNACVSDPNSIIGFLIGSKTSTGVKVVNILPTAKSESFNDLKQFVTSDDARETIVGVYSLRSVDVSAISNIKKDQLIYVAVTLPTDKNLTLDISATHVTAKTDSEGKREYVFVEAPLSITSKDVGTNVVMATVMSQIFPEVAQELKVRDPLSIESYTTDSKTGTKKADDLSDFADHRITLPHFISIGDLEKQLEDLAKIASEGAKGKNVGTADVGVAKEIASLRTEARACLAELESAGGKQYAGDKIEDVLTAKYIAELSKARLDAIAQSIVDAKETQRRYDNVRSYNNTNSRYGGNAGGYSGGRGGRGGAMGGGRGGATGGRGGVRGRGGRGGSRGGFRGRGAAAAASDE